MDEITPADIMKLQNDNYSIQAEESLPFMLSSLDSASLTSTEQSIAELLRSWDFVYRPESVAATYYEVWYNNLYRNIWDEMTSSTAALSRPSDYITIKLMKTDSTLSFYDVQSTPEKEDLRTLIRQNFAKSLDMIDVWKNENDSEAEWAQFKNTKIGHLLRIDPFSYHAKNGGNGSAINATSGTHGPSWRMITSMEKTGVKAWGVYPGGQSGNPGSQFYNNLIDPWTNGQYFRLKFPHSERETTSYRYFTTTFNSASK
jgi:penicillin amidase